jgi:hypothetical protein
MELVRFVVFFFLPSGVRLIPRDEQFQQSIVHLK